MTCAVIKAALTVLYRNIDSQVTQITNYIEAKEQEIVDEGAGVEKVVEKPGDLFLILTLT